MKQVIPFFNEASRDNYANAVIKAIESKAKSFEKELDKQAKDQKKRLMNKIGSTDFTKESKGGKIKAIGGKTKKIIEEFFDDEKKLWATFSFPFITEYLTSAGEEAMRQINPKAEFDFTKRIENTLKDRAEQFGLGVNETTRDRITNAINAGIEAGEGNNDISDRISTIYDEFPTWRSDMIARTEATAANNDGFMEAYKQSDVVAGKEWIATQDGRTRPEHLDLDGEIVGLNENFSNGLPYPQEINCRCVLAPAVEK